MPRRPVLTASKRTSASSLWGRAPAVRWCAFGASNRASSSAMSRGRGPREPKSGNNTEARPSWRGEALGASVDRRIVGGRPRPEIAAYHHPALLPHARQANRLRDVPAPRDQPNPMPAVARLSRWWLALGCSWLFPLQQYGSAASQEDWTLLALGQTKPKGRASNCLTH